MATITSAGVGSGLDLESIIKVTLDAEDAPKFARFEKQTSTVDLQLTALGQMKSGLSSFNTQLDILKNIDNFQKRAATVTQPTDGDVISVTASNTATTGNFDVKVNNLAQGSRAVMNEVDAYSASTDVVTTAGGKLTFTSGAKTFDITLAANATLEDLRTALNDSPDNFGVSANIINTGGATPLSRLVYTSTETGAGNDVVVTNDNAELDRVSTLANAGGGALGGMSIAIGDEAQDAELIIDGISTFSSSNTFTNAIQDLTITALKEDPANSATLKVATDKEAVKGTLEKFVESFNGLVDTLNLVARSKTADATARGLRNTLLNQMGNFVSGAGDLRTIYDIGISLDKNNKLSISSTAVNSLDDALTNSYDDVGELFSSAGGIATVLGSTVDLYLQSGGIIKDQQDALGAQKKAIEQDKLDHTYRMELFEKRLREKYANLDVLISGMRSQGNAVTSALSNLPGFTRNKN